MEGSPSSCVKPTPVKTTRCSNIFINDWRLMLRSTLDGYTSPCGWREQTDGKVMKIRLQNNSHIWGIRELPATGESFSISFNPQRQVVTVVFVFWVARCRRDIFSPFLLPQINSTQFPPNYLTNRLRAKHVKKDFSSRTQMHSFLGNVTL